MVILPRHLSCVQERVHYELANNEAVAAALVIVTVPRATLEACSDRDTFMAKADPALLRNWGDANEMSGIVGVLAPLQLQRCPATERKIPPPKWEEEQLSLLSAAVALTITRVSTAVPHSFQKVGSFDAIKGL